MKFQTELQSEIVAEYNKHDFQHGWRFLYSPAVTMDKARVAFIGLNPGGNKIDDQHSEFCMPSSSAYATEKWREFAPGKAPLQKQVLSLFELLGEDKPEMVLAGNLVPFRSPRWASLSKEKQTAALIFGASIWKRVLCRARPKLVIAMGKPAREKLKEVLSVTGVEENLVNWGNIKAERGDYIGGVFVGLPHLSTFKIINRPKSKAAVLRLFRGFLYGE